MKRLLFLIPLLLLLLSCSKEDPEAVNIRIINNSDYRFEQVYVNTSGGEHTYGNVESQSSSAYHSFTVAYPYAYVRLYIDGEEFVLQPKDYVGEEELPAGNYSYVLEIADFNTRRLSLNLRVE
jgi:hypothetical protein